jgi:hypothetical protein
MDNKKKKDWSVSLGTYPGIVVGMRTYHWRYTPSTRYIFTIY